MGGVVSALCIRYAPVNYEVLKSEAFPVSLEMKLFSFRFSAIFKAELEALSQHVKHWEI